MPRNAPSTPEASHTESLEFTNDLDDLDRLAVVLDRETAEQPDPHGCALTDHERSSGRHRRTPTGVAGPGPSADHSTASAATGETRVARRVGAEEAMAVRVAPATTTMPTVSHGIAGNTIPGLPFSEPRSDCAPTQP
jgi:hypothetical protein